MDLSCAWLSGIMRIAKRLSRFPAQIYWYTFYDYWVKDTNKAILLSMSGLKHYDLLSHTAVVAGTVYDVADLATSY